MRSQREVSLQEATFTEVVARLEEVEELLDGLIGRVEDLEGDLDDDVRSTRSTDDEREDEVFVEDEERKEPVPFRYALE